MASVQEHANGVAEDRGSEVSGGVGVGFEADRVGWDEG